MGTSLLRGKQSFWGRQPGLGSGGAPEAGDTMPGPRLAPRKVTGHGEHRPEQGRRPVYARAGPESGVLWSSPARGRARRQVWSSFTRSVAPLAPRYLISMVAPASSNFFLIDSASSFETASLMVAGADSTRSLASLRPRLVTSRTALMTLIFFSPAALRTTSNSVFSSTTGAAAAPPPAGAAATAAAAETP